MDARTKYVLPGAAREKKEQAFALLKSRIKKILIRPESCGGIHASRENSVELIMSSSSSSLNRFEIKISGRKSIVPGIILVDLVSHHDKELRVNIVQVRIKTTSDTDFHVVDNFKIMASAGEVDKTFRIDLDPFETRDYGISIPGVTQSFECEITARDQRNGWESVVSTQRDGFNPPENFSEATNKAFAAYPVGANVIPKSYSGAKEHPDYVIAPEDGTPNDFGIFDKHEINPTAAYIALGRDGYKTLKGKHIEELDWDRDTMAYPPDDLVAVHIRNTSNNQHGWYFRRDLVIKRES